MIKTLCKGGIKLILVAAMALIVLFATGKALRPARDVFPDDTGRKVEGLYALEKNSLDILFLGTSHAYYGINPAVIYEQTGLNSYVMSGECQPIQITYHYLKDALKTQTPSLVVLDIFGLAETSEYCQSDGIYRVNIEQLKESSNKVDAYAELKDENLIENVFDASLYHDLWSKVTPEEIEKALGKDELNPSFGYSMGAPSYDAQKWDREYFETDVREKPDDVKWEAFENIVSLCKEKNIPLLLIKTPCYVEEDDAERYEYVWDYAKENGIPYIDYNKRFKEIGYVFDLDGDMWHSNAIGSRKTCMDLSQYILNNYHFVSQAPDLYADGYNALMRKTEYMILSHTYDLNTLFDYLNAFDITCVINYNHSSSILLSADDKWILKKIGFDFDVYPNLNTLIVLNHGEVTYIETQDASFSHSIEVNGNQVTFDTDGYTTINGEPVNDSTNANITITSIDNKTGKAVDTVFLDTMFNLNPTRVESRLDREFKEIEE